MSNADLINALLDAGLVQFGRFDQGDTFATHQLRLDMLASYPTALKLAAEQVAQHAASLSPQRILCTHDSQPLGTLVSQMMNVPLVIHTGETGSPVRNLIGAYDIGHPTVLISNSTAYTDGFIASLWRDAVSVGLECVLWVTLMGEGARADVPHKTALTLGAVARWMAAQGELSAALADSLPD